MNIDWIETYLDILETRNFNTSAENLGITQSTVSHRVQKLEEALGEALFLRGRTGAIPTLAGERFESHARALRHEWRQAQNAVSNRPGLSGRIRMGIQYDIAQIYAGEIVEIVRAHYPLAALEVEVDYSRQMNRDIERGHLDFALVYSPNTRADSWFNPLGTLGYKMISQDMLTLKDIQNDEYIFPNISAAFSQFHRQELPQLDNCRLECGQSDALVQFMRSLGGASYVIAPLAESLVESEEFYRVEAAPELEQVFYFASHLKRRKSKSFLSIAKDVQSLLKK